MQSYDLRATLYADAGPQVWSDWGWQLRQTVHTADQVARVFPALPDAQRRMTEVWHRRGLRFGLTPYMLSLIQTDEAGAPKLDDPLWRQWFPAFPELLAEPREVRPDEYRPEAENWEVPEEMLTPIAHHKYGDRVIIYLADTCLSYCGYCLRSLMSNDPAEKHGALTHWTATLRALATYPEITEVILSGGDPLIYTNEALARILQELRQIQSIRTIRIHSRAFSHNPFRIDDEFCRLLVLYRVTGMSVHVCHPNELTADLDAALERIRRSGARTQLLAQTPLLKGVNDNVDVLRELFLHLWEMGIKPYYLLHCMPNVPCAASQRTSVRRGVELMLAIGRNMTHPALPEYIIVGRSGKQTVPLPAYEFKLVRSFPANWPTIHYIDWRGNPQTYLDSPD